jgi:hypothetical protein
VYLLRRDDNSSINFDCQQRAAGRRAVFALKAVGPDEAIPASAPKKLNSLSSDIAVKSVASPE